MTWVHHDLKSRNDDLGQHVVPFGGEYTIDFCPSFWETTLFFCRMSWSREAHWFDIYDASRDSSRCGNNTVLVVMIMIYC
ncbi:hypothetical protein SADUNF_Sadunf18G0114200 [Salix dunnii]|uniref:S-protein homolog n=1 Tax=Salix dunnii TaxID=1413687 RepID=A0A835J765_9ROSI|nr:hypothetical protein SADUNF_Sadunf18G0114200 [Salix dunnii]